MENSVKIGNALEMCNGGAGDLQREPKMGNALEMCNGGAGDLQRDGDLDRFTNAWSN